MEKKYRNTVALDGVSMSIPEGVTCLLGRNGAGKSTLVRLLVGVEKPSAGRVTILHGETEVRGADKFARIGWLPQSFGFPARMGVEDFVSYAAWLKRVPRAGLAESVGSTLDLVDLRDSRHKRLGELSGGMLRRAGLAAAIVHRPSLLVLDEPTAGLDPVQRTDFHRRIAEIAKTTSVLLATHLLEDVQALGRFVSILDQGSLVWRGTAAELVETVDATGVTVDALRQALLRQIGVEFP
ncbi:MAG: ATP-binding cassette domain-containing protein [Propionibacteriales bacterium]|nr:ATP-binding cassette domain-containing protein [Propionibacteriales bacterium]